MGIRFTVTDPRGCSIICTEERWVSHILHRHGDVAKYEPQILQAIQAPYGGIFQDPDFPDRNIYYHLYRRSKPKFIKVIVEFGRINEGCIITSLVVTNIRDGETLIWP